MLTRPRPPKGTFNKPEYRAVVADYKEDEFDADSKEMMEEAMEQDRLDALDAPPTARPDLPSQSDAETSFSGATVAPARAPRKAPAKTAPAKTAPAKAAPAKAATKAPAKTAR